jgi:FkbM family methyltransferase
MLNRLKQIVRFIRLHPLARLHPFKAYQRFLKWQFSQMLFPGERVVPFVGDTKLIAKKGLTGVTANIYTGLEDFSEMGFLMHFLRPDDLFADMGANAGSYTVLASGYSGAATIAFEPVPATFIWLKKNIEANQLQHLVQAYNCGLGSANSQLHFTSTFGTVNHVVSSNEDTNKGEAVLVDILPFDSLIENGRVPCLVKIDVEGFETEVLAGMHQALHSCSLKAIIIELNGSGRRYGYDESLIHDKLLVLSFLPYRYDPFKRELVQLNEYGSHNTIYVRDIDYVKTRLMGARRVHYFCEIF